MPEISVEQQNWAAGELSPKMRGRGDLLSYRNGAERLVNFISETSGPKRFRAGFIYAQNTRRHNAGWLFPFQFNASDAYELEFTEGYIRFFRNNGVVTLGDETISGVTITGSLVTLTITSNGYSNGDEIIINGIVGTTQLNNRSFVVTNKQTNSVDLLDSHGNALDGSAFSAYTSGGVANKIYEIATPYLLIDIPHLKISQNADVLYIDHNRYESRKLTRFASNSWTLGLYTRYYALTANQKAITAITNANPAAVTCVGHGFNTGDQVLIGGVTDMTQVIGLFTITTTGTDTFTLNGVNSIGYTTYGGGGYATNIIGDPFTDKKTISAITKATQAVVTSTGHGYSTGQIIYIEGVLGMTEINGKYSSITKIDNDTFSLDNIDSTGFTTYSSVGYASDTALLPSCLAFYQGRLIHAGSDMYPESIWGSNPLDDNGNPQYDFFLMGVNSADAFKFTLSPISAKVDKIESLVPSLNFLAICTFEGISKCDGGTTGDPISPSTINITPVVTAGCLQQITPFLLGITMVYIHRCGLILESLEYDIFFNAYNAMDKNLTNDQWPESGVIQMCWFVNRPTGFWFLRNDGILIFLSYMVKESINAAGRIVIGGTSSKVLSVGVMPRANQYDQAWIISERVIDGQICRFVEYQADDPIYPEKDDFWSGEDNAVADDLQWRNAMFEAQKQYIYMDAAITYDGSDYGVAANATLAPATKTGDSVIFTASNAVFTAGMVGRQLWKQAQNGIGSGRAIILSVTNSTHAVCQIISDFDATTAIPAGEWYLTTITINGAWHLEGETVRILTDGSEHPEQEVIDGSLTLEYDAGVVHIGEGYNGMTRSMHVISGSPATPTEARKLNINRLGVKFLNTLGARFGTNLYNMQDFQFKSPTDLMDRPSPLFSEHLVVPLEDNSEVNKHVYILQVHPLPCCIQEIVPFVEIDEQ